LSHRRRRSAARGGGGGGGAVESEERKGGVREIQELEGILYRAKRGAEGARLWRWAARSVAAAING
jgi:hypothetical protein